MKTRQLPIAFAWLAAFTLAGGCMHIPPVKTSEYHRTTTVMGVTSSTDLEAINVTEKTAKAGAWRFVLSFPGFHHEQRGRDLVLANPPAEKK